MTEKSQKVDVLIALLVVGAFAAAFFFGPFGLWPSPFIAGALYTISGVLSIVCRHKMARVVNAIHENPHTQLLPVLWDVGVLLIAAAMLWGST